MTINAIASSASSSTSANYGLTNLLKSSASTQSSSELSEEEKDYDTDNDGQLSATEKAAMLEAQGTQKLLERKRHEKPSGANTDQVDISREGLKMMQNPPSGPPPDVNEMSDDELKSMLSDMKDKRGQLPKELSQYNEVETEDLSSEDLEEIRKIMTEMQEKRAANMNGSMDNNQQRLMNETLSEYKKYSVAMV